MKVNKTVDARGLTCPLPVVNTKNTIAEMVVGQVVEVLVDNEIAVQNLTKFAKVKNHGVYAEKLGEREFRVLITVGENQGEDKVVDEVSCAPSNVNGHAVVISSKTMGSGDDKLGTSLMKAFIFALTKQDIYPKTVLLYNGGAFLSCEDSDSVEDLKFLEAQGTEILTCGTCLDFYGLKEKLAVGSVTNMYDIVEKMTIASKIVRP